VTDAIETEVLVLGLGAVGSAVAYQLDKRGIPFIGIERQPPPPYECGSSQGETRITREAVGEGADYVPLVRRSHEIWAELEAAGAPPLRRACGVLYMAEQSSGGRRHGADDFLAATLRVAEQHGVPLERLDAAQIRARFPQFEVTGRTLGYFEPGAGYVWPERCIQAQLDAVADQSRLRFGEAVLSLESAPDGVTVRTTAGVYSARRAVVAMGAWIPGLVGGAFAREMSVLRQTLHWFAPTKPEEGQPELWSDPAAPVFIWFHSADGEAFLYGFPPAEDGLPGIKVATEQYAQASDPDAIDTTVSLVESTAIYREHVAERLHGVSTEAIAAKACLYTFNSRADAEGRFMIGPAPQAPAALVVSACSGHGFKHSAGLGEAIVQHLRGEPSACDLSKFAPT
jgi:sarcosine oxidase